VLLLPLQDALSEDPNLSPYRVRSVFKVQVSLAAVELQGAGGTLLMQASMSGVDSKAVMYPKTQDIAFSVSTVGARVEAAGSTGQLVLAAMCILAYRALMQRATYGVFLRLSFADLAVLISMQHVL